MRRFVMFAAQPNDVGRAIIIRMMPVGLFVAANGARLALE
jgi:hypothetical protein